MVSGEKRAQCFQDLLAPGEERIARQGDGPIRRQRGQAGFQQLAGFLVIELETARQFEHEPFLFGKKLALFPSVDGTTVDAGGLSELLLGKASAGAKAFKERSKSENFGAGDCHLSDPLSRNMGQCPVM